MTLSVYLLLSAALFCIGLYGILTRREAVGILLSIELMANAANINFVVLSRVHGSVFGQVFAIFAMAITVAEVVIGLALVMLVFRARGASSVDLAQEFKG